MAELRFDDGVEVFSLNGGPALRFNPADPNLYRRFLKVAEELPEMEREFVQRAEGLTSGGGEVLTLLEEMDRAVKEKLAFAFGPGNDFDAALQGVNLMAVGANGERVVTNLLAALQPVLEAGVERHRKEAAAAAVEQAEKSRAARGQA